MEDTLLFIPPCCVDKKLPKALTQAPYRVLNFYTHGDVTMEKFYRAISYLVVDKPVMVLAMPTATMEVAAFLAQCFDRGWIASLVLCTSGRADCDVDRYLGPYRDRMLYVSQRDVTDLSSHMVLYSYRQALMLSGPMLSGMNGVKMMGYTAQYYSSYSLFSDSLEWGHPLRNILLPDVLRCRKQYMKSINKLPDANLRRFLTQNYPPYKDE